MNIETRHAQEKNRLAKIIGVTIAVIMLLFTAMSSIQSGLTLPFIVRIVVALLVIIVLLVTGNTMKSSALYKDVVCICAAVLYLITIFNTSNNQVYAIMYSIIIIVLIYGEDRLVIGGCIIAIAGLIGADVFHIVKGEYTSNDAFTQSIFAVIACVCAIMYSRLFKRQNKETTQAITDGADVQAQTANEIVRLAQELNERFEEAKDVSNKLNESMDATHSSVMEIVEGTKNTAESIEEQTSETADIQESIQTVGEEATNIGDVSARVEATVNDGVDLIVKLKEQAEEVAKINVETSATTQALNDSIQDVQAITETILGISSQTNLLALNASIEAARAGEAGKGFAVVADEIRALSESTRQATEEISNIIERLTKDAKSAAQSMERSAEVANKQHDLIEETGSKLTDIKQGTDELHRGVVQVEDSVNTVIVANTQIMDSITNLSATSEEVAASTDTVLSVSDEAMIALDGMNQTLDVISKIAKDMEVIANK